MPWKPNIASTRSPASGPIPSAPARTSAGPDRPASLRDAGEAPGRLSEQVVAEVEDVDAQDHQVFAAAPAIFLAPPAELEDFADRPLGDQRLDPLVARAVARLKGHRELDVRPLAGVDDRVARGQVGGERLLAEDAEHPVLGTRQDHVLVAVEPARRDHDELRLFAVEHRAVVVVGLLDPQALRRLGSAFGVLVGDGDDLQLRLIQHGEIEAVTVVSSAGPTDDRCPIRGSEHV